MNGLAAEAFAIKVTEALVEAILAFLQDYRFDGFEAIEILRMKVNVIDGWHNHALREFKLAPFRVIQNRLNDIRALETRVQFLLRSDRSFQVVLVILSL